MEMAHMRLRELRTPWARTTLTNDVLAVELHILARTNAKWAPNNVLTWSSWLG